MGSKQKFEDLLMERAEDGALAVQEWRNLQKRLKTLGGSTLAVSLLNLRQVLLLTLLICALEHSGGSATFLRGGIIS